MALVMVMAILLAGCSGSDEPAAGASSTPPPESTETAGEPAGPHGIPVLDTEEVAFLGEEWVGMNARNGISARNGRLYLGRSIDEATTEIVRADPDTGEIVARRTLPKLQVWSVRDAGVLTQAPDRRSFEVLDLDTLEPLRQFTLPEDARAYVGSVSTEPMWVGLRRFDEDQLQGIFTRMGAAQIDIDAGEVSRSVDLPPCGARNAVEPRPGTLVASNECTNQIMVLDLDTGELTTRPGFPTAAFLSGFGEQVWMRWNSYAVVARWIDGELITLDINGDGPHVTNLVGFIWADDHVLLNSDTEDASLPRLLHRIDPETVTVVGRAWIPPTSTFDGDVGYADRGRHAGADGSNGGDRGPAGNGGTSRARTSRCGRGRDSGGGGRHRGVPQGVRSVGAPGGSGTAAGGRRGTRTGAYRPHLGGRDVPGPRDADHRHRSGWRCRIAGVPVCRRWRRTVCPAHGLARTCRWKLGGVTGDGLPPRQGSRDRRLLNRRRFLQPCRSSSPERRRLAGMDQANRREGAGAQPGPRRREVDPHGAVTDVRIRGHAWFAIGATAPALSREHSPRRGPRIPHIAHGAAGALHAKRSAADPTVPPLPCS